LVLNGFACLPTILLADKGSAHDRFVLLGLHLFASPAVRMRCEEVIQYSALFLVGLAVGLLALLTLRRRLDWVSLIAMLIVWGVAADSAAEGLCRAWWIVSGWMLQEDLFYYGGPAWQTQSAAYLPVAIQSIIGAGLLILAWMDRRTRS
jgi:hypothetical protein